jgi:RNA polymerase sigma-70 factor (ECF subfamily)
MTDEAPQDPDFPRIYDRFFAQVYSYVRYRVDSDAEADDVVSRVFEKALAGLAGFDPRRAPVQAWLFGIARNAVADHFRVRRWLPLDLLGERPAPEPAAERVLADREEQQLLLSAIAALDERQRELLALKFGAGMTNREISAETGIGENHVAVLVYRAVKRLQADLKEKR